MIVERQDIDEALDEWLDIGFSQESLNILKNRLYDRVVCVRKENIDRENIERAKGLKNVNKHLTLFKNLYYRLLFLYREKILKGISGQYMRLNPSNQHVIWLKDQPPKRKEYEIVSKYHEIRHCAIQEIFNLILDKESNLYEGLDGEEVKKRILKSYETLKSRLHIVSKRIGDKHNLIEEIDSYDGDKLEIIMKSKNCLKNIFPVMIYIKSNNLGESSCNNERQTLEWNRYVKNNILKYLASMSVSLGVYFFDIPNYIKGPCSLLSLIPACCFFLRYKNRKNYGDIGIRGRVKENIQNIKDPYGQFLGFITTK